MNRYYKLVLLLMLPVLCGFTLEGVPTDEARTQTSINLTANTNQVVLDSDGSGGTITASPTSARTYTFPDASGTVAVSASAPVALSAAGAIGITSPLPVANGGTGAASWTDGQLLIGNTTGNTAAVATLTGTANQVTVTPGASSITLSAPQDLATTSDVGFGSADLQKDDATANAVTDVLTLSHTTTIGTFGADGIGTGLVFKSEDDAGTEAEIASIDAIYTDTDNTSEDSQINFNIKIADAAKTPLIIGPSGLQTDYYTGGLVYNTLFGVDVVGGGALTATGAGTGGNSFFGYKAGYLSSSGDKNTAMGHRALYQNSTGDNNTAIGNGAMLGGSAAAIPTSCTAVGANALLGITTTIANNVAIGAGAGRYLNNKSDALTDIEDSVFLGYRTSANAAGDTNETVIGYYAEGRGSHTTTIGNTDTTSWMLYGAMIVEDEDVTCSDASDTCAYTSGTIQHWITAGTDAAKDTLTVEACAAATSGKTQTFTLVGGTDDVDIDVPSGTDTTLNGGTNESVTYRCSGTTTTWYIM